MSLPDPVTAAESPQALAELNRWLAARSAPERRATRMRLALTTPMPGTRSSAS